MSEYTRVVRLLVSAHSLDGPVGLRLRVRIWVASALLHLVLVILRTGERCGAVKWAIVRRLQAAAVWVMEVGRDE